MNLIVGDLHLTQFSDFARSQCVAALNEILEIARSSKIMNLFLLGDIIHDKEFISEEALDLLDGFLIRASKLNIQVFGILGNHDFKSLREKSPLRVLARRYPNFNIISEYTELIVNNSKISLFPYTNDLDEIMTCIKNAEKNKSECVLTHLAINSLLNTPKKIENISRVSLNLFKNIPMTINGHHHLPLYYEIHKNSEFICLGVPYFLGNHEYSYIDFINNKKLIKYPIILLTDFYEYNIIELKKPKMVYRVEFSDEHLELVQEFINKNNENAIFKKIYIPKKLNETTQVEESLVNLQTSDLIEKFLRNKFKNSSLKMKKDKFNIFLEEGKKLINEITETTY